MTATRPNNPPPLFSPSVDLPEMKLAKLREQYEKEALAARVCLALTGDPCASATAAERWLYTAARIETERLERELR